TDGNNLASPTKRESRTGASATYGLAGADTSPREQASAPHNAARRVALINKALRVSAVLVGSQGGPVAFRHAGVEELTAVQHADESPRRGEVLEHRHVVKLGARGQAAPLRLEQLEHRRIEHHAADRGDGGGARARVEVRELGALGGDGEDVAQAVRPESVARPPGGALGRGLVRPDLGQ